MRIRAVLFDAGQTLLCPDPPVETVYAREFERDGVCASGEDLSRALAKTWAEVQANAPEDRYGGVRGEPDFWRGFLDRARSFLDAGRVSDACFARLAAHFRAPSAWRVYPDVIPALETLRGAGLRLGVVSNWDSYLPTLLEALALAPHFCATLASAIERTGKPESEIFRRACRRVAARPEEVLHVGDSIREDYQGAREAGLEAVLLDRAGQHPDFPERIASLAELPDWIARHGSAKAGRGADEAPSISGPSADDPGL